MKYKKRNVPDLFNGVMSSLWMYCSLVKHLTERDFGEILTESSGRYLRK